MSDRKDHFTIVDGVEIRIRLRAAEGAERGQVLILPGFNEVLEHHNDTAERFAKMGLSSVTFDWPGQGLSGGWKGDIVHAPKKRLKVLQGLSGQITGNAVAFNLTVLEAIAGEFLRQDTPSFIFANSMGGHLALRVSQVWAGRGLGYRLAGVILIAPMMMPPLSPLLPTPAIRLWATRSLTALGLGAMPSRFGPPRFQGCRFTPNNPLTRSPENHQRLQGVSALNPDFIRNLAPMAWGRDLYASAIATTGNEAWVRQVQGDFQIHLAGDERIVAGAYSTRFAPLIEGAEIHTYPHARHALLYETEEVTQAIWQRVGGFIRARLAKAHAVR